MKSIQPLYTLLPAFLMFFSTVSFTQKPQKTHDHEKFSKKVIAYMMNDITKGCPDEEALIYISEQSGKPLEQLKTLTKENKEQLIADVKFLNDNGIYRKLQSTEVKVKQEAPLKVADIVLHCEFRGDKIDLTLRNCVQTNVTWVLGDAILLSGDGAEAMMEKYNARKVKNENGLLSKLESLDAANSASDNSVNTYAYQGQKFPMQGSALHTQFYKMELIGQKLNGYVIDKNYEKHETIIQYDAPEILQSPDHKLTVTYKGETRAVEKDELRAFYVGDQLFVFTGEYWDILLEEGAIRKLGRIVQDSEGNYVTADLIQKQGLSPENTISLALGFKNKMSDYVKEHEALAQKISDKASGYKLINLDAIILEYNKWYDENYPEQVDYLFAPRDNVTPDTSAEEVEEVTIILPDTHQELINTWTFSKYYENGEDRSDQYEKGYLEGKPMKMVLLKDGTLLYQKGIRDRYKINSVEWIYIYESERDADEKAIDFRMHTYYQSGDPDVKKYTITTVNEHQLVLEDPVNHTKLEFVK